MSDTDKQKKVLDPSMMQYNSMLEMDVKNKEKLNEFKERISAFKKVKTLEEAKSLASKILPTANEINRFYIGSSKCTVVNKKNMLRICVDSESEFFSYDFQ